MIEFSKMFDGAHGPFECAKCSCKITWRGICDQCAKGLAEADAQVRIARAFRRLPPHELAFVRGKKASKDAQYVASKIASREILRVSIIGKAGAGKTVLAIEIATRLIVEHDMPQAIRWFSADEIATAASQTKLGTVPEKIRIAKTCRVLFIDDLGLERAFHAAEIAAVIYHRHAHGLPTIVTTGLNPAQIDARYGDGIVRRLGELSHVIGLGEKE